VAKRLDGSSWFSVRITTDDAYILLDNGPDPSMETETFLTEVSCWTFINIFGSRSPWSAIPAVAELLLHFACGIAEAKCILTTVVCVSVCLSVCLSDCPSLHSYTKLHGPGIPDVIWVNGRGAL